MKRFLKPRAFFPLLIGVILVVSTLSLGLYEKSTSDGMDAPGIYLIGLAVASLLIALGIFKAGRATLQTSLIPPILAYLFGISGIAIGLILFFDGEFEGLTTFFAVWETVSAGLVVVGTWRLANRRKK
ncbi:MAG: hypothetical protein LBQ15_07955 [Clostridium sp.]|nr:hypothetical protein [Clostridium sp.]